MSEFVSVYSGSNILYVDVIRGSLIRLLSILQVEGMKLAGQTNDASLAAKLCKQLDDCSTTSGMWLAIHRFAVPHLFRCPL